MDDEVDTGLIMSARSKAVLASIVSMSLLAGIIGCSNGGVSAQSSRAVGPPPEQLLGARWALVSLSGGLPEGDEPLTLEIAADEAATVYGGLNSYRGTVRSTETRPGRGDIRFGEFAGTKRSGPPKLMKQERDYLDALQRVDKFVAEGGLLELESGGYPVLRFRKLNKTRSE